MQSRWVCECGLDFVTDAPRQGTADTEAQLAPPPTSSPAPLMGAKRYQRFLVVESGEGKI